MVKVCLSSDLRCKQVLRVWIAFLDYSLRLYYTNQDLEVGRRSKANVVADALSRKERLKPRRARAMSMTIHFSIKARILEAQSEASKNVNTPTEMLKGLDKQLERKEDGGLYLAERIWVPVYGNLRTLIMNKAHATRYSVHPGADKMYYDLRDLYWWPRMKKDISMSLSNRLTKPAHSLANREDYKMEIFSRLYINEIVAGHGVPVSIISDRDRNWDTHLPLVEFPYNNQTTTELKCAPFEHYMREGGCRPKEKAWYISVREASFHRDM
ncbi:putative reverse transcriptase domain-containing protein [Tanacetum coccineum]